MIFSKKVVLAYIAAIAAGAVAEASTFEQRSLQSGPYRDGYFGLYARDAEAEAHKRKKNDKRSLLKDDDAWPIYARDTTFIDDGELGFYIREAEPRRRRGRGGKNGGKGEKGRQGGGGSQSDAAGAPGADTGGAPPPGAGAEGQPAQRRSIEDAELFDFFVREAKGRGGRKGGKKGGKKDKKEGEASDAGGAPDAGGSAPASKRSLLDDIEEQLELYAREARERGSGGGGKRGGKKSKKGGEASDAAGAPKAGAPNAGAEAPTAKRSLLDDIEEHLGLYAREARERGGGGGGKRGGKKSKKGGEASDTGGAPSVGTEAPTARKRSIDEELFDLLAREAEPEAEAEFEEFNLDARDIEAEFEELAAREAGQE